MIKNSEYWFKKWARANSYWRTCFHLQMRESSEFFETAAISYKADLDTDRVVLGDDFKESKFGLEETKKFKYSSYFLNRYYECLPRLLGRNRITIRLK